MTLSKRGTLIISVCILCLCSVVAYILANALIHKPVLAGDENNKSYTSVATLEEASTLVGYDVLTPTFIPQGFDSSPYIAVHQKFNHNQDEVNKNLSKGVLQVWCTEKQDGYLRILQDPALTGLGGGQPAEVCGYPGEIKYSEANDYRPALFSIYWSDGDMAYVITGTLNGILDKETIYSIAASLDAR